MGQPTLLPRKTAHVRVKERLRSLGAFFTDREHGTVDCLVPYSWREPACKHPLWRIYACSSWAFSIVGVLNIAALAACPGKVLYPLEWIEGVLWIWQGLASYLCDVHDFARPSISHPVDRASAALLAVQQCIKYTFFATSWGGSHFRHLDGEPWSSLIFSAFFVGAVYSFRRSSRAVREGSLGGFLAWHSAWHFALPASIAWWFAVYYVLDSGGCAV